MSRRVLNGWRKTHTNDKRCLSMTSKGLTNGKTAELFKGQLETPMKSVGQIKPLRKEH
jgi:hypothetical protein